MADKKYPYHSDFDSIAGMRLDYSSNFQLKATNAFMRVQTFFDRTEKAVEVKKVQLKGYQDTPFEVEVLYPKNHQGKLPCLFFTHGGGFMLDIGVAHYKQCVHYVTELNCIAVMPHYHLAVDHPFPHGLQDCHAALNWVFDNADDLDIDPSRVAVGGESAGGGLSASLTQMWRDEQRSPAICFQLLTYPVLDQSQQTESAQAFTDTPFWDAVNVKHMWDKYLANVEGVPKYASPMQIDSFANLPAAYIEPAEFCPGRDEGILYAEKLQSAGVQVELNVTKGTFHCFDIVPDSDITKEAFRRRTAALKAAFGLTDEAIELAEGKKYPFSKDFDDLAKFSLDVSSDTRLKMMNFLVGTQYRFTKPEEHLEKKTYTTS
ncbi:MAG: alpha/beta hydrolase, partial [Bacteroidota bacterium]